MKRPLTIHLAGPWVYLEQEKVRLTPTEFRLLALLVVHEGAPVPCDRLMDAVWPGKRNSRTLLNKYVGKLRRKLGDNERPPRYIKNLGYSYAYIGREVEVIVPDGRTWPRQLALL